MYKKRKRRRDKRRGFVLLIIVLLLIFSLSFFVVTSYVDGEVLSSTSFLYTLNVTDYVGMNLDTDKLHFGGVRPGGSSSRSLNISSEFEGFVYLTSDIDWLFVSEQGGFVGPDNPLKVDFSMVVPSGSDLGDYEGEIFIYILSSQSEFPLRFFKGDVLGVHTSVSERPPSIVLDISSGDD